MIERRTHLARNGSGLTACGLVARGRLWRLRWTEALITPRCWRCARCRRVIARRR
jgi:hypothetical protein